LIFRKLLPKIILYFRLLRRMKAKKTYPYPSRKNPIILNPSRNTSYFPRSFVSGSAYSVKDQLIEFQKRIMANEEIFQRKGGKIPALWFLLPTAYLPEPFISSWCFECFAFSRFGIISPQPLSPFCSSEFATTHNRSRKIFLFLGKGLNKANYKPHKKHIFLF